MTATPTHYARPHFASDANKPDLDAFEFLHHYNGVQLPPSRLKFEYPHDVIVIRKGVNLHLARFNCVSAPNLTRSDIDGVRTDPNSTSLIKDANHVYRYLAARAAESDEPVSLLYLDAPIGTSRQVPLLPAAALATARAAVRAAPNTIVIANAHISSSAKPDTQARAKYGAFWGKASFSGLAIHQDPSPGLNPTSRRHRRVETGRSKAESLADAARTRLCATRPEPTAYRAHHPTRGALCPTHSRRPRTTRPPPTRRASTGYDSSAARRSLSRPASR